jgi:hypothetical protein
MFLYFIGIKGSENKEILYEETRRENEKTENCSSIGRCGKGFLRTPSNLPLSVCSVLSFSTC